MAATPTPNSTYTVVQGDSLWKIAEQAYKDGTQWPKIWSYPQNHKLIGSNPNLIQTGSKLFIPPPTPPTSASSSLPKDITDHLSPSPKPNLLYQVKKDDNLTKIAQQAYGDGNQWHTIADHPLNKQLSSNPNLLQIGWIIYIPPLSHT